MRQKDVSKNIMLAGLNCTLDEWLCDSFVELIEEMELRKWDNATRDFWSRLAKSLQQSNISVTWAEQLDNRLASVHSTGKMSWAATTRSIRKCKMKIERIGGSGLDIDSEVWGLDQTTWELMWTGEAAMRKSTGIPSLMQAGYECISDLPRIEQSESISVDITDNEDMCNVVRRAKSSGVDSGSTRTVVETVTACATVL